MVARLEAHGQRALRGRRRHAAGVRPGPAQPDSGRPRREPASEVRQGRRRVAPAAQPLLVRRQSGRGSEEVRAHDRPPGGGRARRGARGMLVHEPCVPRGLAGPAGATRHVGDVAPATHLSGGTTTGTAASRAPRRAVTASRPCPGAIRRTRSCAMRTATDSFANEARWPRPGKRKPRRVPEAASSRRGPHHRQDDGSACLPPSPSDLWANIAGDWLKSELVHAQDRTTLRELETIGQSLRSLERELENGAISRSVQEIARAIDTEIGHRRRAVHRPGGRQARESPVRQQDDLLTPRLAPGATTCFRRAPFWQIARLRPRFVRFDR